jgi:hypothetical protein
LSFRKKAPAEISEKNGKAHLICETSIETKKKLKKEKIVIKMNGSLTTVSTWFK